MPHLISRRSALKGLGTALALPWFESLAVASYFQGRARLAVRAGDLNAAIAALEEGREQDSGYRRVGRWADYHGVFLAGLYLEAGELDRAGRVVTDLAALPNNPPSTIPGLAFHLACRRADLILTSDLVTLPIELVMARGEVLAEHGVLTANIEPWAYPEFARGTVKLGRTMSERDFEIAAPTGRPVLAPARGRVYKVEQVRLRGNMVILDHGLGVYTTYAHLSAVDVKVGDMVERGQAFAKVGSTGLSAGPSLHGELWVGGANVSAIEWTERDIP